MPQLPPAHHETSKRDSPNETKIKEKENKNIPDSNLNFIKSITHHNQTKELITWFLRHALQVKEAYWTETDGAIHVINQKQHGNQGSETAMQLCKQQFSNAMRLHSSKHTGKKSWSYIILQVNCKAYDNATRLN
jgi:hypothetical protein